MTNCVGMAPCKCLIRCRAGTGGGHREKGFLLGWNQCAFSPVHRLGFWAPANLRPAERYTSQQKRQPPHESSLTASHEHAGTVGRTCCMYQPSKRTCERVVDVDADSQSRAHLLTSSVNTIIHHITLLLRCINTKLHHQDCFHSQRRLTSC